MAVHGSDFALSIKVLSGHEGLEIILLVLHGEHELDWLAEGTSSRSGQSEVGGDLALECGQFVLQIDWDGDFDWSSTLDMLDFGSINWDIDSGEDFGGFAGKAALEGASLVSWVALVSKLNLSEDSLSWLNENSGLRNLRDLISLSLVISISFWAFSSLLLSEGNFDFFLTESLPSGHADVLGKTGDPFLLLSLKFGILRVETSSS